MITRKVYLKNNEEILNILGPSDSNLRTLERAFRISIFIKHDEQTESATLTLKGKNSSVDKAHREITNMLEAYYFIKKEKNSNENCQIEITDPPLSQGAVYRSRSGKEIFPKTENQKKYVQALRESDAVFAVGPAGTGKTYLAVAMALAALKRKEVKRIVLARPIIEAGEKLGFLPGDIEEKVNPYLRPVHDALFSLLGPEEFRIYREEGIIETAPLAYMRGRTLENSFIILDEAQNATSEQMKMFLTRMGMFSKTVVTGDITQSDLPKNAQSGLILAKKILKDIPQIKFVTLEKSDVVRHPLVSKIIEAYEKWEKKN
ncbi:MAG: phosphate starvation-inducible protein PhoH [Elusimicrobia bacterium]|nr:phosphate starvation-inducible protein PhoH [Elusimicrobiota bacterium]